MKKTKKKNVEKETKNVIQNKNEILIFVFF